MSAPTRTNNCGQEPQLINILWTKGVCTWARLCVKHTGISVYLQATTGKKWWCFLHRL